MGRINRYGVEETRAGFRPTDKVDYPVKPPRKPVDAEHSARPPAYWKENREKKGG
jgi:hypothetical protein